MKALIAIPDPEQPGLTHRERIALKVRADATINGTCACGAIRPALPTAPATVTHTGMHHEHNCPAVSPALEKAAERLGHELRFTLIEVDLV